MLASRSWGRAVDRPFIADPALRPGSRPLHDALARPDGALEAETRLHLVTERIRRALGEPRRRRRRATGARPRPRGGVRAALDAALFETPSFAARRGVAGRRPDGRGPGVPRAPSGSPPHAYVLGRRLEAARERILDGMPLAEVAAETGFADQAHLTRRFKRFLGTTPGRFGRAPQPGGSSSARTRRARATRAGPPAATRSSASFASRSACEFWARGTCVALPPPEPAEQPLRLRVERLELEVLHPPPAVELLDDQLRVEEQVHLLRPEPVARA